MKKTIKQKPTKNQIRLETLAKTETPEQTKKRKAKNIKKASVQAGPIKAAPKKIVTEKTVDSDKVKKPKPKGTGSKALSMGEFSSSKSAQRKDRKVAEKATKARKIAKKLSSY